MNNQDATLNCIGLTTQTQIVHLDLGKTGLYLGATDASGNEETCVGKLGLRSFQRCFLRFQRRSSRRDMDAILPRPQIQLQLVTFIKC